MCDRCAGFPTETRRSFLRKLAGAVAAPAVLGVLPRLRAAPPAPPLPGSGWARIVTSNPSWHFHRDRDYQLADFVAHETHLKFRTEMAAVPPDHLGQLCSYPFLLSNDLAWIRDEGSLRNLREYLFRGGFIYVDVCSGLISDFKIFSDNQASIFHALTPGSTIRRLESDHPIFHACFNVAEADIAPTDIQKDGMPRALYGVFDDDRMAGLISLATLFCGWPQNPPQSVFRMRQIANIYAYAVNQ